MLKIKELIKLAKLEIQEWLSSGYRKRNELLLRAAHASEQLTSANVKAVREIADKLKQLGDPEGGFYGISRIASHPQLVPNSELGQELMALVLEYAPVFRDKNPELYFENIFAASLNVRLGTPLELLAVAAAEDAFLAFFKFDPARAVERLGAATPHVVLGSALGDKLQQLLDPSSRAELVKEKATRSGGVRRPTPSHGQDPS